MRGIGAMDAYIIDLLDIALTESETAGPAGAGKGGTTKKRVRRFFV